MVTAEITSSGEKAPATMDPAEFGTRAGAATSLPNEQVGKRPERKPSLVSRGKFCYLALHASCRRVSAYPRQSRHPQRHFAPYRRQVSLKIQPAPADSGIKFKRKDLQDEPTIDATIANVKTVERATTIGEGSMRVHTVEHVLSALSALGVDNAVIEMDANEPPIGDGSALPYVEAIEKPVSPRRKRRGAFFKSASRSRSRRKTARFW